MSEEPKRRRLRSIIHDSSRIVGLDPLGLGHELAAQAYIPAEVEPPKPVAVPSPVRMMRPSFARESAPVPSPTRVYRPVVPRAEPVLVKEEVTTEAPDRLSLERSGKMVPPTPVPPDRSRALRLERAGDVSKVTRKIPTTEDPERFEELQSVPVETPAPPAPVIYHEPEASVSRRSGLLPALVLLGLLLAAAVVLLPRL